MQRADEQYKLSSRGRFRVVNGEGVVIRQKEAEVLAVNGVGARVLELCREPRPLSEVITTLLGEFEVEREVLSGDVLSFTDEMVDLGVLELVE